MTGIYQDGSIEIVAIPHGEPSPLIGQGAMEVSYDPQSQPRRYYVHNVFLACYGLQSVIRACESQFNA